MCPICVVEGVAVGGRAAHAEACCHEQPSLCTPCSRQAKPPRKTSAPSVQVSHVLKLLRVVETRMVLVLAIEQVYFVFVEHIRILYPPPVDPGYPVLRRWFEQGDDKCSMVFCLRWLHRLLRLHACIFLPLSTQKPPGSVCRNRPGPAKHTGSRTRWSCSWHPWSSARLTEAPNLSHECRHGNPWPFVGVRRIEFDSVGGSVGVGGLYDVELFAVRVSDVACIALHRGCSRWHLFRARESPASN